MNLDKALLRMHAIAGGMDEVQCDLLVRNVAAALHFGYLNSVTFCWSSRPVPVDSDGMLTTIGSDDQGLSHIWHCYADDHRGRQGCSPPKDAVRIAMLRAKDDSVVALDLIPFTMPEVAHES